MLNALWNSFNKSLNRSRPQAAACAHRPPGTSGQQIWLAAPAVLQMYPLSSSKTGSRTLGCNPHRPDRWQSWIPPPYLPTHVRNFS